jgi:hypothetical protein
MFRARRRTRAAHAGSRTTLPSEVRRRREHVEQHVVPLVGRQCRDAEQRAAGGASRREAGGVDARLRHVHPLGRQPVQLPQPAAGPRAGRDDGSGRREHLALARSDCVGLLVRRPVAERHVHQHDLAQPPRLRNEGLGGGGCDQAVEQHHGAGRNPPDGAREGGVRRVAGPRPGARDRVLAHRPAERGEFSADAPVVGVAAARPRRVVDALRDDDVDLVHSGRS